MYKLPEDFSGSFLLGKQVESVLFAHFQINLHFEQGIVLQIQGGFEFTSNSGTYETASEQPVQHSSLMRVVGEPVEQVRIIEPASLELKFSSGATLVVFGDAGPYEAYIIFVGETQIIV